MCFMTARMADIGTDEPSNSDRPNLEFVASIGLFVCLGFKSLHFANPMCGGSFLVSVAVVTPGRELFYENTSKIVLDLRKFRKLHSYGCEARLNLGILLNCVFPKPSA